nr:RNA polymerase sigma factor [Chloroflexota bacterium]
VVVNDALKAAQKRRYRVPLDELDEPTVRLVDWLTDPAHPLERQLEENEIRENLLKAIHSLPTEQRAVIVMQYYLNLSEADMSAKMDRPLSTIKWWLRDARKRLRELLAYDRS